MIPMLQPKMDPGQYAAKADESGLPAQTKTWGAAASDALSGRYSVMADDEQQSAKRREAAMLFAVAEGHINDNEDFDAALQAGSQALQTFKDLGDIEGVADSLRVVVDAMRLKAQEQDKKPEDALRLATDEFLWFKQEGHRRGQASMLLALARVNSGSRRGNKDREQGVRQAKEALKLYRELGDKPMEGAVLLALACLHSLVKSHQEAIGAANKALALFEDLEDQKGEARAQHSLAHARFASGQLESGKQAAEDAAAMWKELSCQRQEAIEFLAIAQWCVEEEDMARDGVEAAEKALSILDELQDTSRIVAAMKYQIRGLAAVMEVDRAVNTADAAVERFRESGDTGSLLELLKQRATLYLDLEDLSAALASAEEAVKISRRSGDKKKEGSALEALAQANLAREEFVEALAAAKEAIAIFREIGDQVAEAGARHAAVSAYVGRKKLGEALDEAKKARELFRKNGCRHEEGRALLVKSCAHKMADQLGEAVQDATEAQYLFQKEKDKRWESKALHDVAELQAMRENFSAAVRAARKAETLLQETTDKLNKANVLSVLAQIHLSSMVATISAAPKEEPNLEVVEETLQCAWRARDAVRTVFEQQETDQTRSLLAPVEFLLAQVFLSIKDSEQALTHVEEGERFCIEYKDDTGTIIAFILRAYIAILEQNMKQAQTEAQKANEKSKEIGYEFGINLCQGIFDVVENSKDEEGGIPSAPPSTFMPVMPDMPNQMAVPSMRGQMRPPPGPAGPSPGGYAPVAAASAAPAKAGKPKLEPEMVKVQIQDVASSLVGDDIAADTPLMDAGLDSLSMVEFRNELLKEFPGISLPGALLFDYPTVNALRDYIFEAVNNG
eukprot:TRINITY_DN23981_c0_g1_i1.p1 TRINITY_DN23981_c0_g1~~TRINITY_DN23981_c0_g1_i1.p1  ORF type:complete len:849 (+),score=244.94 TRINITY_DN23981_c0_g1_i1:87-2633(+)